MEILLSRILKFLNGCLRDDHMYRIASFIVTHYQNMNEYTLKSFCEEGDFSSADVLDFCCRLGFHNFKDFRAQLKEDYDLRVSQIGLRLINVSAEDYLDDLKLADPDSFMNDINLLCEKMFAAKRVIIIGAYFPGSLSVDFQTDMISFGKEVIQFHHFDRHFRFTEDDVVILMTATGRTLSQCARDLCDRDFPKAYIALITQNIRYRTYQDVNADMVFHVQGRYDGLQFNHQLLDIFDVLRIFYFQKYYR